MSIIYDALQKTQQKRESRYGRNSFILERRSFSVRQFNTVLLLLILCLMSYLTYQSFHILPKRQSQPITVQAKSIVNPIVKPTVAPVVAEQSPPPLPQAIPSSPSVSGQTLVLNGVYVSDQEKLALINNKTFHLGDVVDGLKIVEIEFNRVTLQSKTGALVLTS